jgi:response regulator RpfG family c-di-GMP phosphodiesterase
MYTYNFLLNHIGVLMSQKKNLFEFVDEKSKAEKYREQPQNSWQVLIVDDEPEVHKVTRLVLNGYSVFNKKIELLHAYSAAEAQVLLKNERNIAVILLDVVMETDHAGLSLVSFIRDDLENLGTRIILRTGQPGLAPLREVIVKYEINDYKEKSELTSESLFAVVVSAIRSYRDIVSLEQTTGGIRSIVESANTLYRLDSIKAFVDETIANLPVMQSDKMSIIHGYAMKNEQGSLQIIGACGNYAQLNGELAQKVASPEEYKLFLRVLEKGESLFYKNAYIGYFKTQLDMEYLIYVNLRLSEVEIDDRLIKVYASNIEVGINKLNLNSEIVNSQKELIHTLGESIELRSSETANHVLRVGEYAHLFGQLLGLSQSQIERLHFASPLHDIGKLGIPDYILSKPGPLTTEERVRMQEHTIIGHHILRNSDRDITRLAATIALEHHEHWDGNGYPKGKKGNEISPEARITAISDVFDALSFNRIYKKKWPVEHIFDYMMLQSGKQFDPEMVEVLKEQFDNFLVIQIKYPEIRQAI